MGGAEVLIQVVLGVILGGRRGIKFSRPETVVSLGNRAHRLVFDSRVTDSSSDESLLMIVARSWQCLLFFQWVNRGVKLLTKGVLGLPELEFPLSATEKASFVITLGARQILVFLL